MASRDPLEFEATLEAADYGDAAAFLFASSPARSGIFLRNVILWIVVFGVTLALMRLWPNRDGLSATADLSFGYLLLPLGLILCVGVVVYIVRGRRGAYASVYRRILAGRQLPLVRFRVDARGIVFSRDAGVECAIEWRAFESWLERPERHLLRFGALEVLPVPKTGLAQGQAEALREWIAGNVGPAARETKPTAHDKS